MRKMVMLMVLCMGWMASYAQSSNRGKEFWVAYPLNFYFLSNNAQEMVLYLNSTEAAEVTITGNSGANTWTKTYSIAANSVIATSLIPKSGIEDSRLCADDIGSTFAGSEKIYDRGIHIVSNVPIVAYAHCYSDANSGAALLLPVETWGYNYISLNSEQRFGSSRSYLYVVASHDDSRIQITPNVETASGHPANVPFTIDLKKGQVYQLIANGLNDDLTGTRISSVSNNWGKCYPTAVFSGSSRTSICGTSGDFIMQQCFPSQAWGKKYLTAPFLVNGNVSSVAFFRVLIKDPGTIVKLNGVVLTNLINNTYYEFTSGTADYIESDKPVMVAQYMMSTDARCGGRSPADNDQGDPEMIYISPVEQSINKIGFYRNDKDNIDLVFLVMIIPAEGVNSLKIDGIKDYDLIQDHPNMPGYKIIYKRFSPDPGQSFAQSDSSFTAFTYGLGGVESYGYNAGTLVKNLISNVEFSNEHDSATLYEATCIDTRAQFVLKTEYKPTMLEWDFTGIPELAANGIVTVTNPEPYDSLQENIRKYYLYKLPNYFYLHQEGSFTIPVTITTPDIESCSNSQVILSEVTVKPFPKTDFTYTFTGCIPDSVQFTEATPVVSGVIEDWTWAMQKDTLRIKDPYYIYNDAGQYSVFLKVGLKGGCTADTTKVINLPDVSPKAAFTVPGNICLPYGAAAFVNNTTNPSKPSEVLIYDWKFGEGGTSSQKDPQYHYAAAGSYDVTLIVHSPNGCSDTVAHPVSSFFNRPKANFTITDPELCAREVIAINEFSAPAAGSALTDWLWDLGNDRSVTGKVPLIQYSDAGKFTISLHVKDDHGCLSDTVPVPVEIFAIPYVEAGPEKVMVEGSPVALDGVVRNEISFHWSPSNLVSDSAVQNPLALAVEDQWYYLIAKGGNGCDAYDSVLVKVVDQIIIPNAFSPNGDGINDVWRIPGLEGYAGASVQVFNRWGQKVFESRGYTVPWNGKINGNKLPMGTYYYMIDPHHPNASRMTGSLTIIY